MAAGRHGESEIDRPPRFDVPPRLQKFVPGVLDTADAIVELSVLRRIRRPK